LVALASCTLITRTPALLHPRPIDDEQVYAVVARVMLQGGKPYLDAIERKPPLLFWVYREILAVAGITNWSALHVVMLMWTLCTMALLYVIGRRLWTPAAGWWAAALYALFVMWGDYRTLAFNGELMMNLPLVAALAIVLGSPEQGRRWRLSIGGMLAAVGFLLKQPAGIGVVTLVFYAMDDRRRRPRVVTRLVDVGAVLAGFASVLATAIVLLRHEGILREAVYWTLIDHEVSLAEWYQLTIKNGPLRMGLFAMSALPLLMGARASIRAGRTDHRCWREKRAEFHALCVFLGTSVVGVASNGQFLIHYFLQLLPPLALLGAPAFAATFRPDLEPGPPLTVRAKVLARWLAATAVIFFAVDTAGLAHHREPSDAALFVRARSLPTDRLFVWGQGDQETAMYLDADCRPASRYISIYPLTGLLFGSSHDAAKEAARIGPEAWPNFERDVAAHPPRFIIDADAASGSSYPIERYPVLKKYLTNYRQIWLASDGVVYEWKTPSGARRSRASPQAAWRGRGAADSCRTHRVLGVHWVARPLCQHVHPSGTACRPTRRRDSTDSAHARDCRRARRISAGEQCGSRPRTARDWTPADRVAR